MINLNLKAFISMYHIIHDQLPNNKLQYLNKFKVRQQRSLNIHKYLFQWKKKTHRGFGILDLGNQEGINVPIWIFAGFQQMDRQDSQNLNNNTFYGHPVTNAHVLIGTERYPDNSFFLNFDDDDYFQGYGQIKEAFKALTQEDIPQQFFIGTRF